MPFILDSVYRDRPSRKEWTSYSVIPAPVPPRMTFRLVVWPMRRFRIHWLLVTTPGFRILDARVGNVSFLNNTATDLYLVTNWDKLERLGQLDRVRIDAATAEVGNVLSLDVWHNNPSPTMFEAGFIGEHVLGYAADEYADAIEATHDTLPSPAPPPSLAPHILGPLARSCPECGVAKEVACFGVKRGEFHKRREKDKHR